ERSLLVVVSLDHRAIHFLDDLDAFVGVGVVTDDIAKANVVRAFTVACICQDGFGCFEIRMKIAQNGKAHRRKVKIVTGVTKLKTEDFCNLRNLFKVVTCSQGTRRSTGMASLISSSFRWRINAGSRSCSPES